MKKVLIVLLAILLLSTLISCTQTDIEKKQNETIKQEETKPKKIEIKIANTDYNEKTQIVSWIKNKYALSYHIRITERQLDENGHLSIKEGTYKTIEEKRNIKETFYSVKHLPKGLYQFEVVAENDPSLYDCYRDSIFFTIK